LATGRRSTRGARRFSIFLGLALAITGATQTMAQDAAAENGAIERRIDQGSTAPDRAETESRAEGPAAAAEAL
jgi:hypothetical protein